MSSAARIEELERKNAELGARLDSLKQQLDWFKRHIFGRKSEQRLNVDLSVQGNLLRDLGVANPPPKDEPVETISYQRRKRQRDGAVNDSGLRFGEDVPREIIAASAEALALIGALYRHEEILRERGLTGEERLAYRTQHSEPIVKAFWSWCDRQCHRPELLPSRPLSKALNYARSRRGSLQVFLSDPDVPIDTNNLERGLRPIPMKKKELPVRMDRDRCRTYRNHPEPAGDLPSAGRQPLHLPGRCTAAHQRTPGHKAVELMPRVWKTMFADNPMKSDLALAEK